MKRAWLALVLLLFVGTIAFAQSSPGYLKVNAFGTDVYLLFKNSELRASLSSDKVAEAEPVKAKIERGMITYNDVALPIPQEAIPENFTGARITLIIGEQRSGSVFGVKKTVSAAYGQISLVAKDAENVEWGYDFPVYMSLTSTLTERTPKAVADLSGGLSADLSLQPTGRTVGVGVRLRSGMTELAGITKNGKPVPVLFKMFDSEAKELSSKSGNLDDFGFA